MNTFDKTLRRYGADSKSIRYFDSENDPDLLSYASLVDARRSNHPDLNAVGAVYEWQTAPLVFLVNGDDIGGDQDKLARIRRILAMRGDTPYLGVVHPGQLTLYTIALDEFSPQRARVSLGIQEGQEQITFAHLGNNRPGLPGKKRWITDVVLKLLSDAIDTLRIDYNVSEGNAISLVGRVLFTRFLGDRDLLGALVPSNDPKEIARLFENARKTAETSEWLDETFNGDFLPFSDGLGGLLAELPQQAFVTLGNIMHRAQGGQISLGWEEKWDNLDFAHIPIGVLSQAYEEYLSKHDEETQRRDGGYYTPYHIAELMVRGSFHALRRKGNAHKAKILDPSAGAGVFLLTCFRQLVAERWRHDGKQPNTKTLRKILNEQITGFDINDAALRFAALGLYLLSIELDPEPEPVQKLKFKDLRDRVLHDVKDGDFEDPSERLGSLGTHISGKHLGKYDLVIGNPPWSRSDKKHPKWHIVKGEVSRIAQNRLDTKVTKPLLPNRVLDLPFVWRAMEWAKPDAQIAFALHARLLFQLWKGMPDARSSLFSALNINGVVNGAELRDTDVWREIDAPFCLLYARNSLPAPGSGFHFVSPHLEKQLNSSGALRIDAANATKVSASDVSKKPELLKILFRGTQLDLAIYERLRSNELITLKDYWENRLGRSGRSLKYVGYGYGLPRKSATKLQDASHLIGMPNLQSKETTLPLYIDTEILPKFQEPFLYRACDPEIYKGPIFIVRKSPPAEAGRIRVAVSDKDLVFNESYYGYSGKHHPDGERLVRYLALVIGSKIALWHSLVSSGEFGFERETIEKSTIENFALLPFESLSKKNLEQINPLFDGVAQDDDEDSWAKVDKWVASLFGLGKRDLQVIADTLRYSLPFSKNKKIAQDSPVSGEMSTFKNALLSELSPWAERFERSLNITQVPMPSYAPWGIVRIDFSEQQTDHSIPNEHAINNVLEVADQLAATEILHPDPENECLWIARLNQARYWSRSQARLVAQRIIWDHSDLIAGDPS